MPSAIAERRVGGNPPERRRKRRRIARRHEQRRAPVGEHFTNGRQIGRDDRPAEREVLEQLERRRVALGYRRRGVRQHEHVSGGEARHDFLLRDQAGDGDARAQLQAVDEPLHAQAIGLARMAADDEAVHLRHERERADEDVDALPGVQVPGVGGHLRVRRPARGPVRRHQRLVAAQRDQHALGAVGDDEKALAGAVPRLQVRGEQPRDRHVGVGPRPHAALATIEPLQLLDRRREVRVAEQTRQLLGHRHGQTVRFVDDGWPPRARHLEQHRRAPEVARVDRDVAIGQRHAERRQQEVRALGFGARHGRHRVNLEPGDVRQPVERERIARRLCRVGPHDERDVVPAHRERVTRRHRLHPVGALDGKPGVREDEQSH